MDSNQDVHDSDLSKAENTLQLSGPSVVASGNFLRNKALIELE